MTIGEAIRKKRTLAGMSQHDLEKATEMMRCYLSRVENDMTVPSIKSLDRIAKGIGCRASSILILWENGE